MKFKKFDLPRGSVYLHLVVTSPSISDASTGFPVPPHIFVVIVDSKGTYDFHPLFVYEDENTPSIEVVFNDFDEKMATDIFNKFSLLIDDTSDLMVQ